MRAAASANKLWAAANVILVESVSSARRGNHLINSHHFEIRHLLKAREERDLRRPSVLGIH